MKTAMMELLDMLQVQNPLRGQMIEKEKQQMKDAALFDCIERPNFRKLFEDGFEKYYNKTFKQD